MKRYFLFLLLAAMIAACTPMKPALSVEETNAIPVKGRQGLLIRQKLSFGDYETSRVKRSWTRSGNTRVDLLSGQVALPNYPNLVALNYSDSEQSYYFSMKDFFGNIADVYAVSAFHAEDLQIGDNPNTVVNILQDIFGGSDFADNLFYLQIFRNNEVHPWQLVLDNTAAQFSPNEYTGFFAVNEQQYYTLKPLMHLKGKKGPKKILMGSVGYEIFDSKGKSVAAVSLIDSGEVYLHTKDPDERFLLANLCAALLLQQDVSEAL